MQKRPLIALITDFGTRDAYVGVMKGVMKSIRPDAEFIDITHHIPPQDVRAAAFTLRNNYRYFPKDTVFLVVVDPGVGTSRRAISVRTKHYSFVAPDNGVLSYTISPTGQDGRMDKILTALEVSPMPSDQQLNGKNPSFTFHGRDIFAPQAARVAYIPGDDIEARPTNNLSPIDPTILKTLPLPKLEITGDEIIGEVLYIDHFGNIVTSIGVLTWQGNSDSLIFNPLLRPELPQLNVPSTANVKLGEITLSRINRTYGEAPVGDLLALVGSSGYLEISINGGNAATRLNAQIGDTVTIHIPEGA